MLPKRLSSSRTLHDAASTGSHDLIENHHSALDSQLEKALPLSRPHQSRFCREFK